MALKDHKKVSDCPTMVFFFFWKPLRKNSVFKKRKWSLFWGFTLCLCCFWLFVVLMLRLIVFERKNSSHSFPPKNCFFLKQCFVKKKKNNFFVYQKNIFVIIKKWLNSAVKKINIKKKKRKFFWGKTFFRNNIYQISQGGNYWLLSGKKTFIFFPGRYVLEIQQKRTK